MSPRVLDSVPKRLLEAMAELTGRYPALYFSGGVVRDWLLGRQPVDLDLTVASGALALASELASRLGGAFVPLSESEGVARVVWGKNCLDISQFREGTTTIEDDLSRRDFTVNALAVGFDSARLSLAGEGRLIDPLTGVADLYRGQIRLAHAGAVAADPLRMLRAYRFRAVFAWQIEPQTQAAIASQAVLIRGVSGERVAAELDKILACPTASPTIKEMAEAGLLFHLFPELKNGVGLLQPSSHHLDVFGHSLETLCQMEGILEGPDRFFPRQAGAEKSPRQAGTEESPRQAGAEESPRQAGTDARQPLKEEGPSGWSREFAAYLSPPRQTVRLKYAALFHDLGKVTTQADKDGRITFYNHDEAGVELVAEIARRLHWSNDDTRRIGQLVRQHMWPFHLQNARVRTGVTPKAILKLVKAAGEELIGLFFLAMADSLAGQGPGKPAGMEGAVVALFNEVFETYQGRLKPILAKPLLTGHDLIATLHLTPGPLFKQLLDGLQEARATGPEMTKAEALAWAQGYAARLEEGEGGMSLPRT